MASSLSPTVSVLIVTWNSAAYLPRCLDALSAQTYRDFEVILVDNCSSDACVDGLETRYPSLDLQLRRLDSNGGFASSNNLAAGLARGSWLAVLNPDAFPSPDWLERLLDAPRVYTSCFFASRQIQAEHPHRLDGEGDLYHFTGLALRRNYNFPVFAAGLPHEVFSACAAAAFYPRQQFLDAGGFDPDYFMYLEDVDLGFRLRLRGLRCVLVPAATVHHIGTASTGAGSSLSTYYGHRNLVWTYVKDMPSPWVWIDLPFHLAMNVFLTVYFTLTGRGSAIWRAKIDALRGLKAAIQKRGPIQAQRRVPVKDVLQAISQNPFAPLEGWLVRHYPRAD